MRGIVNVIIGGVLVIGGLSGKLVLMGTGSGGALAALGAVVLILGVVSLVRSAQS
jgi:hypothetical protein